MCCRLHHKLVHGLSLKMSLEFFVAKPAELLEGGGRRELYPAGKKANHFKHLPTSLMVCAAASPPLNTCCACATFRV